jgi:hypothetical protein
MESSRRDHTAAPLLADVFPRCARDPRIAIKHLHLS